MSDRNLRRDVLAGAAARAWALVQNTPDLVTVVDGSGRLVFVNGAAHTFLGAPPEACIGRPAAEFVHPDDLAATRAAFREWLAGSPPALQHENRIVSLSGEIRSVQWTAVADLDEGGQIVGVSSIGRDVTAFHDAERRIRTVLQQHEVLLKEIHHRVKNNLAVIASLFYLESIHGGDPTAAALFEQSRQRVRSMALVHEMLYGANDLARIDLGQ